MFFHCFSMRLAFLSCGFGRHLHIVSAQGCTLYCQTAGRGSGLRGLQNTLQFCCPILDPNNRAYIVRRDQYLCEIAKYSNGDDWLRPVMTQSSSGTLSKDFLLIGRNAWLSQQISLNSLGTKLIEVCCGLFETLKGSTLQHLQHWSRTNTV